MRAVSVVDVYRFAHDVAIHHDFDQRTGFTFVQRSTVVLYWYFDACSYSMNCE